MGYFGTGPLENDDALDFLAEVGEKGVEVIRRHLNDRKVDLLNARSAARHVAAAYLVAISNSSVLAKPHRKLLEASKVDLKAIRAIDVDSLRMSLLAGIATIGSPKCKLHQAWEETGLLTKWQTELKRIADALVGAREP